MWIPENRGKEHTYITDVNWDVQCVQHIVYGPGSDHQTGIDGAADNSAQRVPGTVIEPIQEVVEPILHHVGSGTVIEPWKKINQ